MGDDLKIKIEVLQTVILEIIVMLNETVTKLNELKKQVETTKKENA